MNRTKLFCTAVISSVLIIAQAQAKSIVFFSKGDVINSTYVTVEKTDESSDPRVSYLLHTINGERTLGPKKSYSVKELKTLATSVGEAIHEDNTHRYLMDAAGVVTGLVIDYFLVKNAKTDAEMLSRAFFGQIALLTAAVGSSELYFHIKASRKTTDYLLLTASELSKEKIVIADVDALISIDNLEKYLATTKD